MPRNLTRPVLPALILIALVLLTPTLATALPQGVTIRSAAECAEAAPSLFANLWGFLSAVWAIGSGLEPDGVNAALGCEPNSTGGDTGSGLDPNG